MTIRNAEEGLAAAIEYASHQRKRYLELCEDTRGMGAVSEVAYITATIPDQCRGMAAAYRDMAEKLEMMMASIQEGKE